MNARTAAATLCITLACLASESGAAQTVYATPKDSVGVHWDTAAAIAPMATDWMAETLGDPDHWFAKHPTFPDIDCAEVRTNALAGIAEDSWFVARPRSDDTTGEHFAAWNEVFVAAHLSPTELLKTAIHEAQHHAGIASHIEAEAANACFRRPGRKATGPKGRRAAPALTAGLHDNRDSGGGAGFGMQRAAAVTPSGS